MRNKIREGKAKILFADPGHPDSIVIQFKDEATAFNGVKKGIIAKKGLINSQITAWVYPFLETKGIPTHFEKQLSDNELLVKKVEIIPVELVVRNKAAGSICKRLGIEKGKEFKPPLIEYFYKSDELNDPLIGENHIFYFGWATSNELSKMRELALSVNTQLASVFREGGLELIDFKLEFGRDKDGKVILADEFTPDGCRLWDLKTGDSVDKDRFRQDLGGVEAAYERVYELLQTRLGAKK